ncbi:Putative fatty-acid--CoA ligase FadD21 [Seminavis robusta]|uniref:Fatty-acid--CoA ligase FadD21 n=1 Tax=Seminavis robusta TaxID=568900 RepID=A0A9N8H8J3_9STRA|nr:Putative fatty-acid--CoA ligase FadD21 [Seminavis robusta]|eukprot:Sro93_g048450.1 Putative fatty-acid--CoA ligase FadD21 (995) ;mRNA; r:46710-49794
MYGPWDHQNDHTTSDEFLLLAEPANLRIHGWKVINDGQDLVIMLSASSVAGWIGFGFGEAASGSMLGADVVIVMPDDINLGNVTATDYYVPWESSPLDKGTPPFPVRDSQQDWAVLAGHYSSDTGTVVVLQRKLDTGDKHQDRVVNLDERMSVIFAFGQETYLSYHGPKHRGTTMIQFGKEDEQDPFADADWHLDVTMPNVTLADGWDDVYVHYSMDLGELQDDIMGFDFDAVATKPNFVHHFVVYGCDDGPTNSDWLAYQEPQTFLGIQPAVLHCNYIFGWALGGNALVLPEEVGLRNVRYVVLQGHYNLPPIWTSYTTDDEEDNQDGAGAVKHVGAGSVDSSGFRVYLTSQQREFSAGVLMISNKEVGATIPAGQDLVHYQATCSSHCTRKNPHPMRVLFAFLHMHSHGRHIWVSHYDADGNFKGIISKTEFWNFEFQKTTAVDATVEPGDILRLHCVFDTSKRKDLDGILWGERSGDEMCLVSLTYYSPDPQVELCGSVRLSALGGDNFSYCNYDPVIHGTTLEANAPTSSASSCGIGGFPLEVEFGATPALEYSSDTISPTECDDPSSCPLVVAIVSSSIICILLLIAFVDFRGRRRRSSSNSEEALVKGASVDTGTRTDDHASTLLNGSDSDGENVFVRDATDYAASNGFEKRFTIECFRTLAESKPDRLMYAWLDEEANVVDSYTRKQLWDKSRDLAFLLKTKYGVQPGCRVMIVYPIGIEFLVGLVAIIRVGGIVVSTYPPNPANLDVDVPKFAHFVQDSGAKVALTTKRYLRIVQASRLINRDWPKEIDWVATDKTLPSAPAEFEDWQPTADDVALLQYTSGSTTDPKGVIITHGNIRHQISYLERCHHVYARTSARTDAEDFVNVSWTPEFHDMGLFGSFLSFLSTGGTSYAMSPLTFLHPLIWVEAMRRYKATCTNGPDFGFSLCCKRLKERNEKNGLPTGTLEMKDRIPSLKFVVIGSDARSLWNLPFYRIRDHSIESAVFIL